MTPSECDQILTMETPLFVKCEPGWSSGGEESLDIEQLPSVKQEVIKVEPSEEEGTSTFVKEEHLVEDVKTEPHHEDYDSARQLPSQLHTTDDSMITMYEFLTKQTLSVGCNSNASCFEPVGSDVVENEQEKWTCDCCRKSFRTELLLEKHVLLHGKDKQISPPSNEGLSNNENYYSCDGCGKLLVRRCLHKFKDSNFLLCLQCLSRATPKRKEVDVCTQTSRRKEVHECHHCGKNFPYRAPLTRHILIHTGLKPYSCGRCGKAFSDISNLKRHEVMHTGGKCYNCGYCDKQFTCNRSLKTHMNTHKSERVYKCTACSQSFSSIWFLKRHATIHRTVVPAGNPSFISPTSLDIVSQTQEENLSIACIVPEHLHRNLY